jgi:signal transduction histidine kinase
MNESLSALDRLRTTMQRPRSLFTQMVFLLVAAVLVAKLGSWTASLDEKAAAVRRTHIEEMQQRVSGTARIVSTLPPEYREGVLKAIASSNTRYTLDDASLLPRDYQPIDSADRAFWDKLAIAANVSADQVLFKTWINAENATPGLFQNPWSALQPVEMGMKFSIRLPDGQWLNAVNRRTVQPDIWSDVATGSVLTSLIMVALVAFYISRRMSRPLRALADGADRLGRGETVSPLPNKGGPEEVQRATQAFNAMGERIRRFVDDRTRMLAAISHDLRTPITNLRLRVELLEEGETKARMLETLDELRSTVEAALAFSREEVGEEAVLADLSTLVQSVCDDFADTGQPVFFAEAPRLALVCRTSSLRRAVRNLVENAVAYGGVARVSMERRGQEVEITIADDGPGIPDGEVERVFQPFVRLEVSRNRRTGGVGLGLSIARSVARGHGGDVRLYNRPEGGMDAIITLPVETEPEQTAISPHRRAA